jgi:transcriptional regulator with GAF, ATPase, and Fis domain
MALPIWLKFIGPIAAQTRSAVESLLQGASIDHHSAGMSAGVGVIVFEQWNPRISDEFRACIGRASAIAVYISPARLSPRDALAILEAGARDVLTWPRLPANADQVVSRLQRWNAVESLAESPQVKGALVGQSPQWRTLVRSVVDVAAFSQTSVLIMGESGTGKELIARLVHDMDQRREKGDFVVVDCTTIVPELSGSELFGHERGAFTGAMTSRDGAFAMANRGTLFLDEIGELQLPLQAQLLRAIQEHQFKRVGSNTWQHTEFRLVCATNRNLEAAVASGQFRADLYYRIAGWVCRTSPLRERRGDILPLISHFLSSAGAGEPTLEPDDSVREYLLNRDYPGNVRELRRVVSSLLHRHAGPGPLTIGDVPEHERPDEALATKGWTDGGFESAIREAIDLGMGLREIGHAAAEMAIRLALETESGNLHRAALRLGVTDRALQMRRANRRTSQ